MSTLCFAIATSEYSRQSQRKSDSSTYRSLKKKIMIRTCNVYVVFFTKNIGSFEPKSPHSPYNIFFEWRFYRYSHVVTSELCYAEYASDGCARSLKKGSRVVVHTSGRTSSNIIRREHKWMNGTSCRTHIVSGHKSNLRLWRWSQSYLYIYLYYFYTNSVLIDQTFMANNLNIMTTKCREKNNSI